MAGTSSSAATKCISEVPGLAKQTSTPASTSVERSARAPFIWLLLVPGPRRPEWMVQDPEQSAGAKDALRVEDALYGPHERER